MRKTPVYLDYQATTPLDEQVLKAMMPYLTDKFGNPHSTDHAFGWEAEAAVEKARQDVANLIGAKSDEIIFTSGATEANNIAIKGAAYALYPEKNHVITVATEHQCVLSSVAALERGGFKTTILNVTVEGLVGLDQLSEAITEQTSLVSVMAVNNEIGVLQDISAIAQICRSKDILFHVDAAQAAGKIPLNLQNCPADLMSFSGHKVYGPKGIGALYIREGVKVIPLIDGGGQERGLRSGTLPAFSCVGMGEAFHLAASEQQQDYNHAAQLHTQLMTGLQNNLEGVHLNGHTIQRFPGNINLYFDGIKSDLLLSELRDLAFSTGSACSTGKTGPSHVLQALGLSKAQSDGSIRIGTGRMTTVEEIDYTLERLISTVQKLRG